MPTRGYRSSVGAVPAAISALRTCRMRWIAVIVLMKASTQTEIESAFTGSS